jgi:Ala-tRNA(Pro) deacylase
MSVSKLIKEFLEENGAEYEVLEHAPAYTAQEVAAATHISGHDVAKVVMTKTGGAFIMAVLPASRHLDLDALQELLGSDEHPRLADEREFGELFPDCELGAEPPFGNLYHIPVIVDEMLTAETFITFNAGSHLEAIRMTYLDYDNLVHPQVGPIVTGW